MIKTRIEEGLDNLIEIYTIEIEDDTKCLKKYKDELENVLKESDCLSEVDNSRICSLHKIVERKANQIVLKKEFLLNLNCIREANNDLRKRRKKMNNNKKDRHNDKYILDACCGSRMFWFDKSNKNTVFMDNRVLEDTLCDGRALSVNPDVIGDFRNIPFDDNTFKLVVFDPPHLIHAGENSWLVKKYGVLDINTWKKDIKQGFQECMRVLEDCGVLIFKWNDEQIKFGEILKVIDYKPLFGDKRGKTRWTVFMKENEND